MKRLLRRLSKTLLRRKKQKAILAVENMGEPAEITDGRHSVAVLPSTASLSETVCSSGYGSVSTLLSVEDDSPPTLDCGEYDEVFDEDEDSWEEWNIAASEVTVDKAISTSAAETVYSGYWHGSVSIHARLSSDSESLQSVLSDVNNLTRIRHENIQLFLGVCYDLRSDCISVVMDQQKGDSLYSLVHKRGHRFGFHSITKILSQISQGMDYLHAKGIPHPLLTSKSISVHYQASISMLTPSRASAGFVDSDDLVYLPLEVLREVAVETECPNLLKTDPRTLCTFQANVFSFGTLVYEMLQLKRPFANASASSVIWEVGNNRTAPLSDLPAGKLKQVVRNCWRPAAEDRPLFHELLCTVEQNISPRSCGMRSEFSFSEPCQLMRIGL